jgi:hypothetical protein
MKPWITIWYKTSETFDYLIETKKFDIKYNWIFYGIALIVGIPKALDPDYSEILSPIFALIIGIAGTLFGGLLIQYLWVFVFWIFGKILQGKATNEEIRIVFAYSILPFFFKLVLMILDLLKLFGDTSEIKNIGLYNNFTNGILFLLFLRLFIIGLSKVQKFSYLYALLNILIPITIIGGLIYKLKY